MKKLTFSLMVLFALVVVPLDGAAHACTIPTISILGVTEDESVTIETQYFPAHKEFEVRMGLYGTKGINGILVGKVDSSTGGGLAFTFPIPDTLRDEELIAIRLDSTTGGYYSFNWFTNTTFGTHKSSLPVGEVEVSPTISIVAVKEDTLVIVKGSSFPVNKVIDVLMGEYGTMGIDGSKVSTINSGDDGNFIKTFTIPDNLKSKDKITIRFELVVSDTAVYNWFENQTGASGGCNEGGTWCGYTGIPTFTILSVEESLNVTIQTNNFPADMDFKVLMGKIGTKGVGGTLVTTLNSGKGGSFTATFDIPGSLADEHQIAVRLQTADGIFYAYNWFYNNTTSSGTSSGGTSSGYTGIPTFFISSVAEDDTVTITTNNFPEDVDFKVLMGKMWTQGINGIYVTTVNSGIGDTFSKTFDIPAALTGEARIAIRLQAVSGGFYAYNWFYNTTYP
jgi:hypothetical protein